MTTTTNKGLSLPTVGGESGTWGTDVNNNVITPLDSMLGGVDSIALSATNYTLTSTEAQNLTVKLSGTLLANILVSSGCIGFYCVENNCTLGSFAVTWQANFGSGGVGTVWTIPTGVRTWFVSDTATGARPCPTWLAQLLLAASGATPLSIRRTENDTTPRKAISIQSGSGSGNDYSISETGDASNNVATLTEAIGATTIGTKTSSLLTDSVARAFSSKTTFAEIATPSAPSAGNMNFYAKSGDVMAAQTPGGTEYLIGKPPTFQPLLSVSSATYTPSTGMVWIKVRMAAGGGGGAAAATNSGSNGTDSSFGTWTAKGGTGATAGAATVFGGAGGSGGTDGTGTKIIRNAGTTGGSSGVNGTDFTAGGGGNSSFFGGGAPYLRYPNGAAHAGVAGIANTGGGGSGGVQGGTGGGAGGGAGECVEFVMTAAQVGAGLTYTVGGGGNGGSAGTQPGGNGGSGVIIVEEYYS